MSSKRPLAPSFLKRLDNYLLLNKPEVWSARTHLVVYYGLLFLATLTFISFLIPDDPRSDSPVFYWVGFVIIISIIALTVWLIYLLRFNVFKRYGNTTPFSRLSTFVLYFIAVATIVLFPLVMPCVESIRANKAYSDEEISNDINAINMRVCRLEYDSLPHDLKEDTVLVVNELPKHRALPDEGYYVDSAVNVYPYQNHHYQMIDTSALRRELTRADSSSQINDSMYVFYNSKNYRFIQPYAYNYTQKKLFSNYDIYNKVIRHYQLADKRMMRDELYVLLKKYKLANETTYLYGYSDDENDFSSIKRKYDLNSISASFNNIIERKYRWRGEYLNWIVRFCYYTTLIITLLVFVYRHSTKKAFFLSLLSGVILTILTSLCFAYFNKHDSSFYAWVIFYTILFFVVSLFSFKSKIRQSVTGVCTNLFVLLITFLPSCLVGYYYSKLMEESQNQQNAVNINYTVMHQYQWYAEVGGSLLLIVLLATYIHKVYRQWYALPEE